MTSFGNLWGMASREFGDLAVRTDEWAAFARNVFYMRGDLDAPESYVGLKERLEKMEGGAGGANRLFYLSVAPRFFDTAIDNLGASGLKRWPSRSRSTR